MIMSVLSAWSHRHTAREVLAPSRVRRPSVVPTSPFQRITLPPFMRPRSSLPTLAPYTHFISYESRPLELHTDSSTTLFEMRRHPKRTT